jgi:hypothetical protein
LFAQGPQPAGALKASDFTSFVCFVLLLLCPQDFDIVFCVAAAVNDSIVII